MSMDDRKIGRATVADVARRAGLTHDQGRRFVDAILDELCLGREVRLQGLGVLYVRPMRPRRFSTPMIPGGEVVITNRIKTLRFRRAPTAVERLNGTLGKGREVRRGTKLRAAGGGDGSHDHAEDE